MISALEHLHSNGVVHGDVKPANTLRHNGCWRLADHGLVSSTDCSGASGHTPSYTPPEGPGTRGADIYATGVILFQLATGKPVSCLPEERYSQLRLFLYDHHPL